MIVKATGHFNQGLMGHSSRSKKDNIAESYAEYEGQV